MRLSENPSLQEVLWNFSRVKYNLKERLTLQENPHFYAGLPKSFKGYGASLKIDPTEDFQQAKEFYVLTDKPEMVHIMTEQISRSFGNFWCPGTSIIFKGPCVLSCFLPFVSDVFLDIYGTLTGEEIVISSLKDTYCGFCERLPVSTVAGAPTNSRGLQPIITEGCSLMSWKCSSGCLSMHSSVDDGLRICTGRAAPDIPVRCEVITYHLTSTSAKNVDIAPGPLTTDI